MILPRVVTSCVVGAAVVSLAAACSDDRRTPAGGSSHEGHGTAATSTDPDAAFLEQMIPHHRQALDMAELARTRASSPAVVSLAQRIAAAQAPEILVMADWLVDHDLPVPEGTEHDMEGMDGMPMQGMLSEDQMSALADADGAAFDRLFLTGMIQHHEGAVAMALTVLTDGDDQRVNEIASDVNAGQSAEVARMQSLLAAL